VILLNLIVFTIVLYCIVLADVNTFTRFCYYYSAQQYGWYWL